MQDLILIGGTSHTGKSTLAEAISRTHNDKLIATDSLGRHPGRPWPAVKPHVAEFYQRLSADSVYQFLLAHHSNLWPGIRALITRHRSEHPTTRLIIEGSAIRPEFVADVSPKGKAVWLTASDDFLAYRIYTASGFQQATSSRKKLIDQFLARSLTDNRHIVSSAGSLGLRLIDIEGAGAVEELQLWGPNTTPE